MPCEFNCSDCGDHIFYVTAETPPYGALCAQCLHTPGWFNDPKLVAIFDPNRPIPPFDRGQA